MKLPNAAQALVDIRKLRDYCLDLGSPRGRTKAKVFESVLGLKQSDALKLRKALLQAAIEQECEPGEEDDFGRRYTLDFQMETDAGKAWIRSGWIVKRYETFPRLTTCYILLRRRIV